MTELFLLGAGSSIEAGVPGAYKMTNEMLARVAEDDIAQHKRIDKILQFVAAGLIFQQGIKGENPFNGVNIEDLFNAVKSLSDRQKSVLVPFISAWHPQLVALESGKMAGFTSRDILETINEPIEEHISEAMQELKKQIEQDIERLLNGKHISSHHNRNKEIKTFRASSRFESHLTDAIRQVVIGGDGELFQSAAEVMILKLVEMVWITDLDKVNYLVPLVQYAKETKSTIATLNYDNAIELAGKIANVEIDTGFDRWSTSGDFIFEAEKTPLLKLHGSIDWALTDGQTSTNKPLPYQIIERVNIDENRQRGLKPAVVFGGTNKLTAKGPFLSLIRSFEQHLSKTELLTIIGYSFRDEHVNEFITNWFNGNSARKIRVIDLYPDSLNDEYARFLFQGYAKSRVQVIKETASSGIMNIVQTR